MYFNFISISTVSFLTWQTVTLYNFFCLFHSHHLEKLIWCYFFGVCGLRGPASVYNRRMPTVKALLEDCTNSSWPCSRHCSQHLAQCIRREFDKYDYRDQPVFMKQNNCHFLTNFQGFTCRCLKFHSQPNKEDIVIPLWYITGT